MIRVVADAYHPIEPFAHRFDVRNENHLLEAVLESTQELDDVEASRFVERAEHLVENQEREALPRALG